jgi:polysaccharide biosynthesis protein PslG
MLSCSSRRLLFPRFGLLAMGVMFVAACAAGAPKNASTPAMDPSGAAGVAVTPTPAGVAATPTLATVPAATSGKTTLRAKSAASTPVASGGSSGTAANSSSAGGSGTIAGSASLGSTAPTGGSASAGIVYGFAAPELESWSSSEQVQQLEAMKAAGVTSVRVDANWSAVQPDGPDSYDWTSLDQVMASVQKAGLSADLVINRCPPWAAIPGAQGNQYAQPASSAAFADWAAAVAKRYGGEGAKYFEIWNEPNNPAFWAPVPNPAAYTADLKAAYTAIKTVDPSAIVISGGLAPEVNSSTSYSQLTFLEDMYADGAKGSFDGVGYHPYSYPADPDTFIAGSGWSQMSQTSPSIRSIMAANGDSAKKVWITEYGAPTSGASVNVSDAEQSDELVQAISQAKELSWVGSFYIYTWQDFSGDGFGLLTVDGAHKPAYAGVVAALR